MLELTCVLQVMPHLMQALVASQGLEDFIYGSAASLPLTQVRIARGTVCPSATPAAKGSEGMLPETAHAGEGWGGKRQTQTRR